MRLHSGDNWIARRNGLLSIALAFALIGSVSYLGVKLLGSSSAAPGQVSVPALAPGVPVPTTGAYWGGNNGTVAADPNVFPGCTGEPFARFECKVEGYAAQQGITLPKQSDGKYHASMEHLYMHCSSAESKLGRNGYAWREAAVPGRKVLFINFKCGNWQDLTGNSAADAQVKRIAALLAELPVPVIVSYDAEPEDNSCDPPDGHGNTGTPDDYRAGYRHFVADMREQQIATGKNRISFAWVMMGETFRINSSKVFNGSCAGEIRNASNGSMRNPENWWPGDDVVDWIGTDPYDFYGTVTFDTLMNWSYSFADRPCVTAHPTVNWSCTPKRNNLPILNAEYATCPNDAAYKARWLDNHKAKLRTYPKVKAHAYWSENIDMKCMVDHPFDDATKAPIKAFARLSSDSWLTTPTFGSPPSDTSPPTVSMTAPAAGSSIAIGQSVAVSANATDNVGVSKVEFYRGTTLIGAADTSAPYAVAWNTAGMAAGTYNLTAKAYDAAGNSASSTAISVTLTSQPPSDTTPPVVSITAPSGGSTVRGTAATITATATDNVQVNSVTLRIDDVFVLADDAAPWSFTLDTTKYSNGTHTLVLRAFDPAGNMGESAPVTVTVNNSPAGRSGDVNNDTRINALDLSIVISHDGENYPPADFNSDGTVGAADMAILLSAWTW